MSLVKLTAEDVHRWREALASCAIEGNEFAKEMLALEKTDPKEFVARLVTLERKK